MNPTDFTVHRYLKYVSHQLQLQQWVRSSSAKLMSKLQANQPENEKDSTGEQ